MNKYPNGSWKEFEQWIRFTIGSDFSWRVRPMNKQSSRLMIVEHIQSEIKANGGIFPTDNVFIKKVGVFNK